MAEIEFYTSKYYTAEEMDERLLKGTYEDAVKAGFPGSKEEFDSQMATMVSSSPVTGLNEASRLVYPNKIGTSSSRPELDSDDIGYYYFDTTLLKPIWWNGTTWVDATGTEV